MGRLFLIVMLVGLFLFGAGYFLWLGKNEAQNYENKVLTVAQEETEQETTSSAKPENDSLPIDSTPKAMDPPAGVTLESSTNSSGSKSSPESTKLSLVNKLVAYGYRSVSGRSIDTIVLHSTYNAIGGDVFDDSQIMKEWEDAGVSPHYYVNRSGTIFQLVREKDIAYHAGSSVMSDGRKNVNDFSIGIELAGSKTSGYTDKQYASLRALIADIKSRNKITSVVGHADIAPDRKTDPWMFDWQKLK